MTSNQHTATKQYIPKYQNEKQLPRIITPKKPRKILAFIVILVIIIAVIAISIVYFLLPKSENSEIIGTWIDYRNGTPIIFNADGTGTWSVSSPNNSSTQMTWKITSEDDITITDSNNVNHNLLFWFNYKGDLTLLSSLEAEIVYTYYKEG